VSGPTAIMSEPCDAFVSKAAGLLEKKLLQIVFGTQTGRSFDEHILNSFKVQSLSGLTRPIEILVYEKKWMSVRTSPEDSPKGSVKSLSVSMLFDDRYSVDGIRSHNHFILQNLSCDK